MPSIQEQLEEITVTRMAMVRDVVSASVLRLGNLIINGTPIDTGRARGNWLSAFQVPDLSTREDGGQSRNELRSAMERLRIGDIFYFANSLPYIERLEFGHSAQAPQGMFRLNVIKWESILTSEARSAAKGKPKKKKRRRRRTKTVKAQS